MSITPSRPTLKQVAQSLSVSETTVSLILHGKGRFSEATRQRVLAGAAACGYRPNQAAQAIAYGRFGSLALLLSAEGRNSRIHDGLLDGIEDGLIPHHLHLLLARLPDEQLVDGVGLPKLLSAVAADGLLINYHVRIPPRMEQLIAEFRLPSVWINRKLATNAVYPDDISNARRATTCLLELGHRRIAYINLNRHPDDDVPDHFSYNDRREGYRQAMAAAGLPEILLGHVGGEMPFQERIGRCREWLRSEQRPTAVIAYNEHAAMPLFIAAHALGLALPRDLSLLCFHFRPLDSAGTSIGIVEVPFRAIGAAAVDLVLSRLATGADQPSRALAGRILPGDTVGPPAGFSSTMPGPSIHPQNRSSPTWSTGALEEA